MVHDGWFARVVVSLAHAVHCVIRVGAHLVNTSNRAMANGTAVVPRNLGANGNCFERLFVSSHIIVPEIRQEVNGRKRLPIELRREISGLRPPMMMMLSGAASALVKSEHEREVNVTGCHQRLWARPARYPDHIGAAQ